MRSKDSGSKVASQSEPGTASRLDRKVSLGRGRVLMSLLGLLTVEQGLNMELCHGSCGSRAPYLIMLFVPFY